MTLRATGSRNSFSLEAATSAAQPGRGPFLPATFALLLTLACLALPSVVFAEYVVPGAPRINIHDVETVLRERTRENELGHLLFLEANGAEVRLITTTDDPEIVNRGDGSFHPADPSAVFAALDAIAPHLIRELEGDVFLLPFPRSGRLASSAHEGAIYITPGVREYDEGEVHFLVAHELGHVFQREFLPTGDPRWAEYAEMRGIGDATIYHEHAAHADRPREIFAEDFRALFGGTLARGSGAVENSSLRSPDSVVGLSAWFGSLVDPVAFVDKLRIIPNPAAPGAELSLAGLVLAAGEDVRADLIDVQGRVATRFDTAHDGRGGLVLTPDIPLRPGAYWVRVSSAGGSRHVPLRILR